MEGAEYIVHSLHDYIKTINGLIADLNFGIKPILQNKLQSTKFISMLIIESLNGPETAKINRFQN